MMWSILLLLLKLLAAARCDVRARDPEVEEREVRGRSGWERLLPQTFGTRLHTGPHGYRLSTPGYGHVPLNPGQATDGNPEDTAPPSGDAAHQPTRAGNWCAFVHRRTVTTAVQCGTEKYTIKSLSPCPSGPPDCRLVLYKLSVRPVYKEMPKLVTSLLWRCCPGHEGLNCEDTVADGRSPDPHSQSAGGPWTKLTEAQSQGVEQKVHLSGDLNPEQSDYQPPGVSLSDTQRPASPPHDRNLTGAAFPEATAALMAHIQPVLDGFSRTLSQLSQEVDGLSRGLSELQRSGGDVHGGGRTLEARIQESADQITQMRALLSSRSQELEERLHSQNAALHLHMTAFKADTDARIKHNQDSLRSLNDSVSEVKLKQRHLEEAINEAGGVRAAPRQTTPNRAGLNRGQPGRGGGQWEAIARLERKVANNTLTLAVLEEKSDRASQNTRDLWRGLRGLEHRLAQTGERTRARFSATGQEVEADRAATLGRVEELADNLTASEVQLGEMDSDLDYLYQQFHSKPSLPACHCRVLTAALSKLQQEVANITETAKSNRLVLEDTAVGREAGLGTSLEDLHQGLLQVRNSLAFEQEKSRTLRFNVSQLQMAHQESRRKVDTLMERDKEKTQEIRHHSGYFSALLKDAIRHTEVLEVLLGEEVMEFEERPSREQEQYSIVLLRDKIQRMQEQIESHSLSIASLMKEGGVVNDEPSVGQSEWLSRELERKSSRDAREDTFQDSLLEDSPEDYSVSDFWSMGREVEELEARVRELEGRRCFSCCNCTGDTAPAGPGVELRGEVAALRRGLEEHLQMFQNVFSNSERLAGSKETLDLNALWALVRRKEGKKQRNLKEEGKEEGKRDHHRGRAVTPRNRRDTGPETTGPSQSSDAPPAFLASTYNGAIRTGTLIFETVSLNYGKAYSPQTGVFQAPEAGVYLFLLTLDFGPGASLAVLKRGAVPAGTLRQSQGSPGGPASRMWLLELEQGERVTPELRQGIMRQGNQMDNTFAAIQVLRST